MMINEAQAQATAASGRGDGQYPSGLHDGAEISTAAGGQTKAEVPLTMEAVITRENLMLAYQRMLENKGAAGVDNLCVAELKPWLKKNWSSVRQALIDGNYQPRAIRRMDLPKPDGGVRTLGIPTVVDRRGLRLIRRYLKAEMVKDGQREKRQEGMPQGGPLSPLLSNILLDELDKDLERRGHSFCCYADDCNIYVSSRKAGDHLAEEHQGVRGEQTEAEGE